MRLTPEEVRANQTGSNQIGSSGLAGVTTKVLFGDPSKTGFYAVVLSVPAHTTGLSRRLLKFSGGSGDILRDVLC
jgi:hypothetical protein